MPERPWVRHYDEEVPHTLAPYPRQTLLDVLRKQVAANGQAVALRFEGRATTYETLLHQAEAFGRGLEARGVRAGDRVALILPNVPQMVIAELGAWMAGAIVAPMNPTYTAPELAELLTRARATVAVVLAPFYWKVKEIQSRTPLRHVIVAHVRDALPFPKNVLFRIFKEAKEAHGTRPSGTDETMAALILAHAGRAPLAKAPGPDDVALLLPSGGTTGTPKLAISSHGGLAISGRQLDAWLGGVLERNHDTLLVPLPLFHVYAAAGIQTLAFTAGLSMALVPNPRDTASLLASIRRERPAFLCAVPGILAAIARHPDFEKTRDAFRAIKLCFSGAAPLLAETLQTFERVTGGIVVEGYSLTEGQMAVIANPMKGTKKIGSVGLPLPDIDLKLVDIDGGEDSLPPGTPGEVLLAAPQLMIGYWDQPVETAEVLTRGADGRMWLHTGDIGHLDDDGYLYLTDRKKELIKVSGYQVWPREIEEVLVKHPAVAEAGVAAVQDAQKGERPKAWVVLKPDTTATGEELRTFCANQLAPYKVPIAVAFVPELPKTAIGKVLRRKLRELDAPVALPETFTVDAPAVPGMVGSTRMR